MVRLGLTDFGFAMTLICTGWMTATVYRREASWS